MTTIRLGEVAKIKHGFAFKSQYFTEEKGSYMLLTPGNFQPRGGYRPHKPKYFAGPIPMEFVLNPGELLLLMTDLSRGIDTLGSPLLVPSTSDYSLLHNQRIGKITNLSPEVNKNWLYYRLQLADYHDYIVGTSTGSTVHHTSPSTISEFSFEIPDLKAQKKIAEVLGALDDKIVANQTSISKIDEILRALWQKELSLGNIDVPLSSLASFINGKAFTKGASGTGRVVVRIAEMNSGIGSRTVYSDFDAAPDNVVDPGELLFSWSGTLMTKRWPYDQAIVNQHIFKVVPNGQLDLWALRQATDAQLEYFQMIAAGKATTMGHIKRGDLDQEVEVPAQMSEETNQLGNSLWGLATSLEIQNLQLSRTRDELLPLLLSGRITVGEAEEAADGAGSAASES
ncbi:restriction endonuclease subunit S [Corynebacterium marquesiae]|uniref:restriction endonuclease subunit S n=1 Tax=Corynebacterium marquesiae TaxID=2913503 RepID=UPI002549C999|nr:restriction endonuclease subunit S [Corynebacterium marquesiae]MDK8532106.1 restriction endonuclease subunit S [Corynebacterium marquesiae]